MKILHKLSGDVIDLGPTWEAVKPEPVWRDVTAECEAEPSSTKGWRIFHSGDDVGWAAGYRIRKVNYASDPMHSFIIEKREP